MFIIKVAIAMGRKVFVLSLLVLALLIVSAYHLSTGAYGISVVDVLKSTIGLNDDPSISLIANLRLRRLASALLAGFALGVAGATMQSALRNPLASPFTLGISQAAALGVAVALLVFELGGRVERAFIAVESPYLLALAALTSAFVQLAIVLSLAYVAGLTERALILAAISMSFFYGALVNLIQYLKFNEIRVAMLTFWLFGDVGRPAWQELYFISVPTLIAVIYLIIRSLRLDLDLLSMGDEIAASSGVDPRRARLELALVATIAAALVTAFMGVLAFICLLAPHIARLLVGHSYRFVVLTASITGALLVVLADAVGRSIISPATLPVGVVGSLLGAPLLIALLLGREVFRRE
ncbi:MAG: iron ABC transporter permease [Acidilobaceae archaeon]